MTPHTYHKYYLACINDGGLHRRITNAYRGYRGPLNRLTSTYLLCERAVDSFCRDLSRRFCLKPVQDPGEQAELYHAVIFRLLNGEDHESATPDGYAEQQHTHPPGVSAQLVRDMVTLEETVRFLDRSFRERKFARNYSLRAGSADETISEIGELAPLGAPCTVTGRRSSGSANTQTLPKTNQGEPMTTNIKIEQRTFLNGAHVSNYTDAHLIDLIERAEAEIERLRKVKTKSEKITGRINELKTSATALAELLDTRTNSK